MGSDFDPRTYAFVDRPSPLSDIGEGNGDLLALEYLESEGAREQTDEDPGPSYWQCAAEMGSYVMHWMTLGWFRSCGVHVHQERREVFSGHLALCTMVTINWPAFDPAYSEGARPVSMQYIHWTLDPDVMGMAVWRDDPGLSPEGWGHIIANQATHRLRQHLRKQHLEHLGDQPWINQSTPSPIWPTSWGKKNLIYSLNDVNHPATHPRPTSKSSGNSKP